MTTKKPTKRNDTHPTRTHEMKTKKPRKTLGQIAYEKSGCVSGWQESGEITRAYYDRMALAVAKEVMRRLRREQFIDRWTTVNLIK